MAAPPKTNDRTKSLEFALAQIDKQFGKNTVMRLGDEVREPMKFIPTGSTALDVALGIGGLPRGRVVEIYGPESSGKCLTADTLVWTDHGLETVEEVFARAGEEATCETRVTDVTGLGLRVVSEHGDVEGVAALTHNGLKPVVRVVLASGREVTATHNHPLRVVDDQGDVVWRHAGQIAVGDTVVSALFGAEEAASGLGHLTEDDAAQLGREVLAQAGALDAAVPHPVRTAGAKAQGAFLSALLGGGGQDTQVSALGLDTASRELARQVQVLLYGFGVPATLRSSGGAGGTGGHAVAVDASAASRLLDLGESGARLSSHDEAPRFTYEAVAAVEDGGEQPTFDLMVPGSHSFLANGVLSHNTTVALHAVANAQKAGGIAAFIDAEHALDPEYAKKLGVDTDALLVSQPDTGEQALEIADMLVRSGALDIIVIDSVAALVPRAEIEGEMGDSHVGLQARLMSQALRKMTGALSTSGTTAIFINQLREKIGVMFGCFSYSTRVTLADGSSEKIGKIVNRKLPVEVLTYDAETDQVVPRRVTNWFDNGPAERFLQFTVEKSGGNGRSQFAATANHLIRTPGGWREAGELIAGDRVMLAEDVRLSSQQWQVVLGGLMGDAHLAPNTHGRRGVRFRMGHGAKQTEYIDWKASQLGNVGQTRSVRPNGAVHIDLSPLPELSELREVVYWGDGKKHLTDDVIKALTPLALAVWYMDDGSFALRSKGLQQRTQGGSGRSEICVEAMSEASRERLVAHLRDEYGVDCKVGPRGARGVAVLTMTTAGTDRFHEVVAPYVHPSMAYKLLARHQGKFSVEPQFVEPTTRPIPAKVLAVHVKPPTRSMHRFDIEVEGTHNYFVDGVMVHNSPETTTGGKALKFYASIRLDVRRIETLKDGNEPVGNRTRVKVVKNKCLAAGTRVFDPKAGRFHRIEDVVDRRLPIHVMAADTSGRLHAAPVTAWFDQGEQEVVEVAIEDGLLLTVTPDHRVLTKSGWQEAGALVPGDQVAVPRQFTALSSDALSGYLASVQASAEDELVYSGVESVTSAGVARTYDVEVDELHNLVAEGVVVHNCAPPFKQAEFDILYGFGISREGGLIDMGVEHGFIRKSGAWYTYEGDQLGQGKENARTFLRDNPDLGDEIERKIKDKLGVGAVKTDEAVELPAEVKVDF